MAGAFAGSRTNGSKINTLEGALSRFGLPNLLQDLDGGLVQVRQRKKTKEEHLACLRESDRRLLKQSISHHPDRIACKSDKPDGGAHDLQAALNATRTVLLALTEVFLEHIDINYKYDFFSDIEINVLLSDKERELLVGGLSRSLRKLTEVKGDVVIREIRKFLLKSQESIKSFLIHDVVDFERHRDHAVYHLEKCIEGYETLASECSILERECKDSHLKHMIRKAAAQNSTESKILCDLHKFTRLSLGGPFLIFSIVGPTDEFEYFVLPFVYYVFILLMCTLVVDRRVRIKGKDYPIEPPFFKKEPDLYLTAYYLACYCNDRNLCREEVERILRGSNLPATDGMNAEKAFHDRLKKIDCFLADEFKIEHYDAGKTCEEQFNDRLTRLTVAVAEVEAVKKDILEKINQFRIDCEEIRRGNTKNAK